MRGHWRDGERIREVDLTPLGAGRYRVAVDGSEFELAAEPLGAGCWRLTGEGGVTVAEIDTVSDRTFVRLGTLDFVLTRERSGSARRREGGAGGSLELLAKLPGRRILIHVNNTNPMLREDGPEHAAVHAAGVEVAHDGLELRL